MATIPKVQTLSATSVDILNMIRNNASQNYRDYIPQAKSDTESIKAIGSIMMDYPALQNEFLSALVNRIGRVIITSKMYQNPWSHFKKGLIEMGETVEEIFVNIAKPFQFDPAVAENKIFKREIPDVRAAFHIMNYQKYYKTTVSNDQLRTAFLTWDGITDLISKIVDAMYTGANYDEFQVMKYLLAKNIMNGRLYPVTIPSVAEENMKTIVSKIKGVSNDYTFLSDKYNVTGVMNISDKSDQYLIINTEFDATMDVEVLASAFNMDKASFSGHRVLIDGFGNLDNKRLAVLFENDPNYEEIPADTLTALNAIPCVLVDKDYFMIFDNYYNFTEQYNGEGLYWNYWYHTWKTFSVSPFANNALFIPATPAITTVAVTPATASLTKGQSLQLNAVVTAENFAPQSVVWSIDSELSYISNSGKLTVPTEETATTIKVTATSTFDNTKIGTATITIE